MPGFGSSMRRNAYQRSRQMYGEEPDGAVRYSRSAGRDEPEHISSPKQNASAQDPVSGLLAELFSGGLDSDRLLLLAIIYMLFREGADKKLLLALAYVLL